MKEIKKLIKDIKEQEQKAEEKRQNNYLKDILRQVKETKECDKRNGTI